MESTISGRSTREKYHVFSTSPHSTGSSHLCYWLSASLVFCLGTSMVRSLNKVVMDSWRRKCSPGVVMDGYEKELVKAEEVEKKVRLVMDSDEEKKDEREASGGE
uniref:Uncharacterized protein n=1 Tax=Oryza punctata TaxID=4537 RepID=A0A0E0L4V4_ORYPU